MIEMVGGIGSAVEAASDEAKEDLNKAMKLLGDVAKEQFPERFTQHRLTGDAYFWDIALLNDHEDTTQTDVLLVMDKAAVLWDERLTD